MNKQKNVTTSTEGVDTVTILITEMISQIESLTETIKFLTETNKALIEVNTNLNKEIVDLKSANAKQEIKIAELEARLNKNSSNSSKPPSGDGYRKKAPINSREKSGMSTGGQLGHVGNTLDKVPNPDKVIEFKIQEICDCGCNLENTESTQKTRQIFDIPKPQIEVTEYVTNNKVCPECGKIHKTEFPPEVTQPTQYGENIHTLMNYLTLYQLIPLSRAVEAIHAFTGQSVSEGTLVNAAKALYEILDGPVEAIKNQIINTNVVHFDETGARCEGETIWLHAACTEKLTFLEVNDNRGVQAGLDIDILPNFTGVAVHDHWKPYYCFKDCTHAECNAHNLRYLRDIAENYHQDWANEMSSLLIEIKIRVKDLNSQGLFEMPNEEIHLWQKRYHNIIEKGILEDAEKSPQILNKKGKLTKSKALQLLFKLRDYDIETLAFMYDFNIPFDNNLAERDIRMQKLRQKISGCFRSKEGAKISCRVRSYIYTARKNGIDALEAIARALQGQPFIPEVQ